MSGLPFAVHVLRINNKAIVGFGGFFNRFILLLGFSLSCFIYVYICVLRLIYVQYIYYFYEIFWLYIDGSWDFCLYLPENIYAGHFSLVISSRPETSKPFSVFHSRLRLRKKIKRGSLVSSLADKRLSICLPEQYFVSRISSILDGFLSMDKFYLFHLYII